jgi:hypothetical protein
MSLTRRCPDWKVNFHYPQPLPSVSIDYENEPLRSRLWCSACDTRHPAYLFPPGQRNSPPLKRRCLGMGSKLHLCAYSSFTFADLEVLLQEVANTRVGTLTKSSMAWGVQRDTTHPLYRALPLSLVAVFRGLDWDGNMTGGFHL